MAATHLPAPAAALATNANALRDIKPPVDIPSGWEWVWWTLGILLVAALASAVAAYFRKHRPPAAVEPPVPAHLRAKQRLQEALALVGQPKPFCVAVADTIRFYLEERFTFHAPERTTEEFLYELRNTPLLLPDQKESLGEFLKQCDLVKFARYQPGETELRGLHQSAVRLVEETEPPPNPSSANPSPALSQ